MNATESLLTETWEKLCTTPGFSHPGFTCDVLPDGRVVMSPTFNYHGWFQARISVLLAQLAPQGQPFVELAVLTPDGLFEVDVAWTRNFKTLRRQKVASPAPEVCVEVASESNTDAEFERKRQGLFAAGCREVWMVAADGTVQFFTSSGRISRSEVVPEFPVLVEG